LVTTTRHLHSIPTRRSSDLPKLVRSINLGVLDLHKRFLLKEGTVVIRTHRERHRYYLRPEFQVNNGRPKPGVEQYIEDQFDKLTDRKSTRLNSSHVKISYAV